MKLRFWGTRGSLPVALTAAQLRQRMAQVALQAQGQRFDSPAAAQAWVDALPFALAQTYGGHSSCVEIESAAPGKAAHEYLLCDFGSGARTFGNAVLARHGAGVPNSFHVFMSHLHWDHIMGFPLFGPAYIPGNRIRIYGCHAELEQAFRRQHGAPSFPVEFDDLPSQIEFVRLEPGQVYDIAGYRVQAKRQLHGGDSYGYRFERDDRSVVYSTDSEHKLDNVEDTETFVDFFRAADVVVFDAMYSLADSVSVKEDWGHSNNVTGVELCQLAGVRTLVLFHHEPVFGDERIAAIEADTRRLEEITREGRPPLRVIAAYDSLELEA
ncbi:MBL fold metallo-hydrolase [Solimonas sp. K1W22B-7]|uniref:MBL fold metallo-hydrolase n=1 Tax=Solimonas sp. K1W22B-7 TaxID=2303331 RepID=UPI000E335676|nr:MBL fold metallo-hydrolase [Solimonas sp. K1W22B-7]AXQ30971.1 MBL fold metallo-hydrolase [Solimonas sp. K1W22B-7]